MGQQVTDSILFKMYSLLTYVRGLFLEGEEMEKFIEPIGADREFIASYLLPIYEELKRLNDNLESLTPKKRTKKEAKVCQEE